MALHKNAINSVNKLLLEKSLKTQRKFFHCVALVNFQFKIVVLVKFNGFPRKTRGCNGLQADNCKRLAMGLLADNRCIVKLYVAVFP